MEVSMGKEQVEKGKRGNEFEKMHQALCQTSNNKKVVEEIFNGI